MTNWSSTRSWSGLVRIRGMYPVPDPLAEVYTVSAPTNRSLELVVVTVPLLLIALFPVAPATTSTGLRGSIPLYSMTRMSG